MEIYIAFLVLLAGLQCGQERPLVAQKPHPAKWELASGVVEALRQEHRGGSLIYRGRCVSESQIVGRCFVGPPTASASLNRALNDIKRKCPGLKWTESGDNIVRVIDTSARADVLSIRVKDFRLQEVANPHLALSEIWNIPEVHLFAHAHHITFMADASGMVPPDGTYTRISIDVHDATVAEIMDKISQSYRRVSDPSWHSVWLYRECERRGEKIVELQVM